MIGHGLYFRRLVVGLSKRPLYSLRLAYIRGFFVIFYFFQSDSAGYASLKTQKTREKIRWLLPPAENPEYAFRQLLYSPQI
jgi:hypothetical protein